MYWCIDVYKRIPNDICVYFIVLIYWCIAIVSLVGVGIFYFCKASNNSFRKVCIDERGAQSAQIDSVLLLTINVHVQCAVHTADSVQWRGRRWWIQI